MRGTAQELQVKANAKREEAIILEAKAKQARDEYWKLQRAAWSAGFAELPNPLICDPKGSTD